MIRTQLGILLLSVICGLGLSNECPEEYKERCDQCDIDRKCISCKDGYYYLPETELIGDQKITRPYGNCLICPSGCTKCTEKQCLACEQGKIVFELKCHGCQFPCSTCEKSPDYCLSCPPFYVLDKKNDCYFRYTIVIVIACIIGGVCILFMACQIVQCLIRRRNAPKGNDLPSESFLGEEFRKENQNAVVSDVSHIGRTFDADLSGVFDDTDDDRPHAKRKSFIIDHDESISHDILKDH